MISSEDPPREPQRIGDQMIVQLAGKGQIRDLLPAVEPEAETEPGVEKPDERPNPRSERLDFRVFNSSTQLEFRVTMLPDMLDKIRSCHEGAGLNRAGVLLDGEPKPEEGVDGRTAGAAAGFAAGSLPGDPITAGLSNGIDGRTVKAPTTSWPWRAISQFRTVGSEDSGCTGTLIGPRHLITAAHCINARGTNTWFSFRVTPAKDGPGNGPYGSSDINPNPQPGDPVRWYFTPEQWRSSPNASRTWDWGLIVIPDRLGDLTSWLGYVAVPSTTLGGVTKYNRGYPSCNGFAAQPAGCQTARLYGDNVNCAIGSYSSPGSDGWNRTIAHHCDTSPGHSGSSIYFNYYDPALGQYWPVVTAVHHSAQCQTCSPLSIAPNRAHRIVPSDLNVISWLRETFP